MSCNHTSTRMQYDGANGYYYGPHRHCALCNACSQRRPCEDATETFYIAEVTYRGCGRPGDNNQYRLRTPTVPSRDTLAAAQTAAGYHPAGYGGPDHVSSRADGDEIVTTWTSSSSCD